MTKLLYLLGAGRSGTTILSLLVGNQQKVITLGEMHQFLDTLLEEQTCSCSERLENCPFWSPVVTKLLQQYDRETLEKINKDNHRLERHSSIFGAWFGRNMSYLNFQKSLLDIIAQVHPAELYVDSSKYNSKGVRLLKSKGIQAKAIYLVRDVRGVVYSFGKQVQTSKGPLSAIVYYNIINKISQLVYWRFGRGRILKLRHEDVLSDPKQTLEKINAFAGISATVSSAVKPITMQTGHFIGGNRLVKKESVVLKTQEDWPKKIAKFGQLIYYFLACPIMIINRYKIRP